MQRTAKPPMMTAQRARAHIAAPKESGLPPRRLRARHLVRARDVGGFTSYEVRPVRGARGHVVLYVHGGGYFREISRPHWTLISRLADVGVTVEAPLYGLAPKHTYREAFDMLTAVYRRLVADEVESLTIIGDSAGGGLAASFVQTLADRDLPRPDRLVLISPWLDMTMSNPDIAGIYDPWLTRVGLLEAARVWADGTDPADPLLSPLNGPLGELPKTHVYIGTRDLLYPDVLRLRDRARAEGVDLTTTVCHNAIHVYPLVAAPEGRAASEAIVHSVIATPQRAER